MQRKESLKLQFCLMKKEIALFFFVAYQCTHVSLLKLLLAF